MKIEGGRGWGSFEIIPPLPEDKLKALQDDLRTRNIAFGMRSSEESTLYVLEDDSLRPPFNEIYEEVSWKARRVHDVLTRLGLNISISFDTRFEDQVGQRLRNIHADNERDGVRSY